MLAVLAVAAALAASAWGFTADQGTRLPEGVSTEALSVNGTIWAWTSTSHGMTAYTSTDGLSFTTVSGFTAPGGNDAAVVPLATGGWRMYLTRQEPSGKVIGSATSRDLRTWTPETGVRVELGPSRATGVPEAVVLPDGRVRLYYVEPGGNGESIESSISSDGLTFTKEEGARLTGGYVDPAVVQLSDGTWLMVASTSPVSKQKLYTATSTDGLTWTRPTLLLDRSDGNALDPTLLPLGGDRLRVYYSVAANGQQLTGPYWVESGILEPRAAASSPPATKAPAPQKKPAKKPAPRKKKKH